MYRNNIRYYLYMPSWILQGEGDTFQFHSWGWVSDCCLITMEYVSAISWQVPVTIWCYHDNVLDQNVELDFHSVSQLNWQSTDRHVAPFWQIILTLSQPAFIFFSLTLHAKQKSDKCYSLWFCLNSIQTDNLLPLWQSH